MLLDDIVPPTPKPATADLKFRRYELRSGTGSVGVYQAALQKLRATD
jgi:hypothetical protein